MPTPNPVFLESWEGYTAWNDSTVGVKSRWVGDNNLGIPSNRPPHRTMLAGPGNGSGYAAFDSPILDGEFCWHINLGYNAPNTTATLAVNELRGSNPNQVLLGVCISEGRIRISGHTFGTLLWLSPPSTITDDAMHSIIVRGRIHATLGELNVELDGFPVGTPVTGINTQGTNPDVEIWHAAIRNSTVVNNTLYTGPMAVFPENVSMMPSRFIRLFPDQDLSPLNFTRDAGTTNFSRVNGALYNAVGFVSSNTPNHEDNYRLTDLPSPGAEIYGINVCANVLKVDAGTRIMEFGIVDNGQFAAVSRVLPASRITNCGAIGKSPDTNDNFTFAQINAMTFRHRIAT